MSYVEFVELCNWWMFQQQTQCKKWNNSKHVVLWNIVYFSMSDCTILEGILLYIKYLSFTK